MTRTAALRVAIFIVVLGVPDGAVGVLWPSLRTAFHRPIGDLGVLAVVMTVLYVGGGILFSRLSHRIAIPAVIRASCLLSVLSTTGWLLARSWLAVLAAVAAFGLARGVVDSAVNAASAGRIRELGWLHAGWAVGGTLGPILVAGTVAGSQWRGAVAVIAGLSAVVTIAVLTTSDRPDAAVATGPNEDEGSRHRSSAPWTATLVVAGVFAVYTAAEAGPVSWGYVYLVDDRHLGTTAAAFAIASLWLALVAGRVALGAGGHRVDEAKLLDRCSLVIAAALLVLWLAPNPVALVALPVVGLASAPVFPLLVNRTPSLVGSAATPAVVGVAVAAGAVGGPLAVLVEGQVVNAVGTSSIAPCLFAAGVLFGLSCLSLRRVNAGATVHARDC